MAEGAVLKLVDLAPDAQRKALSRAPRKGSGPAGRPSIQTVKSVLVDLEHRWDRPANGRRSIANSISPKAKRYAEGIRDALRWISGSIASEEFLEVINTDPMGVERTS